MEKYLKIDVVILPMTNKIYLKKCCDITLDTILSPPGWGETP